MNSLNPFASRISRNSPAFPVAGAALILGFLTSTAWITNDRRQGAPRATDAEMRERLAMGTVQQQEHDRKQVEEIAKLRAEVTRLQNSISEETGQTKVLNQGLQDLKQFAGLTEVAGPGVTVTLSDGPGLTANGANKIDAPVSESIIHDKDVLRMVNELFNAGADAIAVNGIRVSVGTSFRCVGSVVLVDTTRIASPIVIQAIGDPKTLEGAIKIPGGIYEELKMVDARMVNIASADVLKLPAYSGSTSHKYAKPVKEQKP